MKERKRFGKRGSSHFEIIISFIIFFGFVIFLLLFIRPQQTTALSGSVVSGLYDSFREQSFVEMTEIFVRVDADDGASPSNERPSCFYLDLNKKVTGVIFLDKNSLIEEIDDGYFIERSNLEGSGKLYLEDTSGEKFYKAYLAEDFNDVSLSCEEWGENYFDVGSVDTMNVVSYKSLEEMRERYFNNYESLKEELNIPSSFDFSIVTDIDELNMEGIVPLEGDIVANDYLEKVLFDDGRIENHRFTLKVF